MNASAAVQEPRYLYGFHDPGGEHLMLEAGKPGWVLVTEEVGHDPNWPSGRDYGNLADNGLGVIVRLNNGYYPNGTIPEPQYYGDFARRCANFVSASRGCHTWIIGNEMNHSQERPHDQLITPDLYARCYLKCRQEIHARAGEEQQVVLGAVAPYNIQTPYTGNPGGDWIRYFADLLNLVQGNCDGIALHAYTWGSDPNMITSEEHMGAPYDHRRKQFRVYRDFMEVIPQDMRHLPVYITEANQGGAGAGWEDVQNTWIQRAYQEIDAWNRQGGQQIRCLLLYRWSKADRWQITEKQQVIADFKAALAHDYRWGYQPQERFFPETGKWVRGAFLDFFDRYGLELCGRPISDAFKEQGRQVQYFQQVAMEEVEPGKVRLKLIGTEVYESRARIQELEEQVARLDQEIVELKTLLPLVEVDKPPIEDIVDQLPKHATERYATRSLEDITHVVVHHSATRPGVTAEQMARYHVDAHGWPGIGYHFVVTEEGILQQTNELASISYHAAAANASSIGICFTGDFTSAVPPESQLESGAHLIAWLLQELDIPVDRVQGHKVFVSGTTCPGEQWDKDQRWGDLLRTRILSFRTESPWNGAP